MEYKHFAHQCFSALSITDGLQCEDRPPPLMEDASGSHAIASIHLGSSEDDNSGTNGRVKRSPDSTSLQPIGGKARMTLLRSAGVSIDKVGLHPSTVRRCSVFGKITVRQRGVQQHYAE